MMMDGEVVVVVLCEQCSVLLYQYCLETTASWVLAGKARHRHGLSLDCTAYE
jgi:hypothetical protein